MAKFENRPVVLLDFDDLETEVLRPEGVVLVWVESENSTRKRSSDVGCFCYRSRDKVAGKGGARSVDLGTFDDKRVVIVKGILDYLRATKATSVEGKYTGIKRFFDWIDNGDDDWVFGDLESMKTAYHQYTVYLNQLMHLAAVNNGISAITAESYQKGAAVVVSVSLKLPVTKVKSFSVVISRYRGTIDTPNNLSSQDERSRTFSSLVSFVNEVHRAVLLREGLPIQLSSPNDPVFNYYVPRQTRKKGSGPDSILYHLKGYEKFPELSTILSSPGLCLSPESKRIHRYTYGSCRVSIRKFERDPRGYAATSLVNRALTVGLITFISATGTNLSVVQELEVDTGNVVPSTQGKRYSGTKGRANGVEVFPEFGIDYVPLFNKIMDLRKWLLNGRESKLVFPFQGDNGLIGRVELSCIAELKRLFKFALPNTVWVTPTQWRKGVGSEYVKLSDGDTVLAAEKLGNSERVVRGHYARPSVEDTAAEMSCFFDSICSAAISRARSLAQIPVKIIDDLGHPSNIPTGYCERPDNSTPMLADGFTPFAPTPSCGEPVTCLFCKHYAVHANEQDLRRLLSLEYLLTASQASMANESYISRFAPMLHRVDEVLKEFQVVSNIDASLITSIRREVEGGELDSFWAIHFNTFVSLGVVI